MKVDSCPKCDKKGSLIFTTTKNNGRKYAHVKHYDSLTKSSKKCSIPRKNLLRVKFTGKWYREYECIIAMIHGMCDGYSNYRINGLDKVSQYHRSILLAACSILEGNGYLKYMILERLMWDVIDPELEEMDKTWETICDFNRINSLKEREFPN